MHAFVRSLAAATPVVNANVRLIARNNEVLGTVKTDSRGYARFDAGLKRGEGGLAPAVLVAETADGDYAFLDLATGAFDLTDRGVKGRIAPGPIDAFAYTDRGVYRAGEQVHLAALARDSTGKASGVPVTVIFSRPDGVEHSRVTLTDQGQGGRADDAGARRLGHDRHLARQDAHRPQGRPPSRRPPSWSRTSCRSAWTSSSSRPCRRSSPQEPGTIKLAGRYLYGPPAAGLAVEGEIAVKLAKGDLPGFAGYKFGLADEQVAPVRKPLEGLPVTDAEGKADIAVQLPALPKTSRPLEADVILKLRESGGRTIERTVTLPVDLKAPRIGIKPLFKGGQAEEGELARFEAILLGPDGKAIEAKGLKWELMRLEQRWQWYSRDGSWNYESQTSTRRIAAGTADAAPGTPAKIEAKVDWGRYRLEVSTADGSGLIISSMVFSAGYYADEAADSPEVLDVALDKPSYQAGETARVKIASRMAGRALIAVMSSGLASTQEVDLPAGGGEVPIRVSDDWSPGAYVTVMLYRPMDEKAKRMPARALGLRWLAIDQAPRMLNVRLEPPEKVKSGVIAVGAHQGRRPRGRRGGAHHGCRHRRRHPQPHALRGPQAAGLVLRPAPARHRDPRRLRPPDRRHARGARQAALRRRRLGRRHVDAGQSAGGGDARPVLRHRQGRRRRHRASRVPAARLQRHGAPVGRGLERRQGRAPPAKDVIVRDPVALTVSGPRFLTLGDKARLELAVHNVEGAAGSYSVTGQYESEAGAQSQPGFERAVALTAGERKREAFELKPRARSGRPPLPCASPAPTASTCAARLTFDVKVPAGDIRRLTVSQLAAKGGKITLVERSLPGPDPAPLAARPSRSGPRPRSTCRASSPRSTATPTAAPSRPPAAPCRCSTSTTWPSAWASPPTRCCASASTAPSRACSRCRTAPAPSASGARRTATCG